MLLLYKINLNKKQFPNGYYGIDNEYQGKYWLDKDDTVIYKGPESYRLLKEGINLEQAVVEINDTIKNIESRREELKESRRKREEEDEKLLEQWRASNSSSAEST